MKKGDILYYSRIIPNAGIYDVLELKIRTITEEYFTGIEKHDKQVFLFNYSDLNKRIFENRKIALDIVKEAEKNKKEISNEKFYEEY